MRTYSAGIVTAYGAAKVGGYTGTYEEFCEALGALANVLEELENFTVDITTLPAGEEATASYADGVMSLGIPKGDKGDTGATGNGITSITKTDTSGLVDTYTILYTDGTSTTFTVTNGEKGDKGNKGDTGATGNGIASITLTSTAGAVKTYTILYTDGTSTTFDVTDGEVTNAVLEKALLEKADVIVNTASGAIANFSDGAAMPVKDLTVNIEPVQDLNGQDAPYPAGGGKNLVDFDKIFPLPASNIKIADLGADKTFAAITITLFCTNAIYTSSGNTLLRLREGADTDTNITAAEFGISANTLLNGTYSITRTNVTLRQIYWIYYSNFTSGSMKIQVESGSVATDYVPYSNICPITGWDAVKVTRTGVNLVDTTTWYTGSYNPTIGSTINPAVRTVTDYGNGTFGFTNGAWAARAIRAEVKEGQTYCLSGEFQGNNGAVGWYITDKDYKVLSKTTYYNQTTQYNANVTAPANSKWLWLYFGDRSTGTITENIITEPRVTLGTSAAPYEPYNGQTVTIQLGQTVYGGTLDVNTGMLTIDRATDVLTSSSNIVANTNYHYLNVITEQQHLTGEAIKLISSHMPVGGTSFPYLNRGNNTTAVWVIVKTSSEWYDNASAFKAWLDEQVEAGTPMQISYKLLTPITIQLTAEQLSTIKGINNIFADSGDVSVQYGADTKLYIDNAIATAIAAL